MVPIAGGPLAAALALAMGWSYNRRMTQWLERLAEAVTELQDATDGLTFEDLAENEDFTDAVVNASRAAQATHQQVKLDALRNGVLHSLLDNAVDTDTQARFFRLVEQFTAGHLRLLVFMDDPGRPFDDRGEPRPQSMGGRGHVLEKAMPEFAGRRDWYDLLHSDLAGAHLINSGGLQTTMSTSGLYEPTTTALGQDFLRFIAPPRK